MGLWYQPLKVLFNQIRVVRLRQVEPFRDALDMGIDDDTGLAEDSPENDIRGLSPDAWQGDQFLHRVRDLFAEAVGHGFAAGDEMFRFILKEAGGTNELFEFGKMSRRQLSRLPISPKQRGSHLVDPLVSALGREDCGDEQLPRGTMVEFHCWTWHSAQQDPRNCSETLPTIQGWQKFRGHDSYQKNVIVQRVKDEMQACLLG